MELTTLQVIQGLKQLPGLTGIASSIAMAWLMEHHQFYESAEFNVRLGQGVAAPVGAPDYLQKYALSTSMSRADIVLHAGRDVTIVEIKIRIGGSALGQLEFYRRLWRAQHPETEQVFLVAVGQSIQPGALEMYNDHNMTVALYPNVTAPAVPVTAKA